VYDKKHRERDLRTVTRGREGAADEGNGQTPPPQGETEKAMEEITGELVADLRVIEKPQAKEDAV
jgi:hypothetical protein